ncbi:MAG: pantetheine-phosphate adenylyltransferase [Erysipelotrichaceae bacterium]|jgi:pantetheine-phosphate adenylyltransferase
MKKAIYPGTFDPITLGHLDIIRRASTLVDQLEVVIMRNPNKSNSDFSVEERLEMISSVIQEFNNVTVSAQTGLTVEYAKVSGASILIRGIRAVMDYEYELQQATANMVLAPNIETVFLLTRPQYSFLSSSVVKQIAQNKGDLAPFVPAKVKEFIERKFRV